MNRISHSLRTLLVVGLATVSSACGGGSQLAGLNPGNPNSPPLPPTDAGLANHAPGQIIVKFESGANRQPVLTATGATIAEEIKALHAVVLKLPNGASIVDTIRKVQNVAGVKYAEPDYLSYPQVIPNDPGFQNGKQWGPQKIGAPAAWDVTTGASGVVLAVLDTGVWAGHEDLAGKVLAGRNFTTDYGGNPNNTDDNHGHGTHVAGIAAAFGNNARGVAGLAWGSPILPIKVLPGTNGGLNSWIANGIIFAADYGVLNAVKVVINLSLGGPGYNQLGRDAVDYAMSRGALVVAAMGNSFKFHSILYPAAFPNVMSVGATDAQDRKADFSNMGPHVSVSAPGVEIYSTVPSGGNPGVRSSTFYRSIQGTSQAAPHVSGLAALVWARNPSFGPNEVRRQIEQTTDDLGAPGFDQSFGHGRINAARALGAALASNLGSVRVTVLRAPGGTPEPDADVIIYKEGSLVPFMTAKTSDGLQPGSVLGQLIFDNVPTGNYYLTASKLFDPVTYDGRDPGSGTFFVPSSPPGTTSITSDRTVNITPSP